MSKVTILKGHIIYTDEPGKFEVVENGYVVAVDGEIKEVCSELPESYKNEEVVDYGNKIIMPGFYDLHLHAGQYLQCGTGMNKQLLDWLQDYTYDLEKDFVDTDFADRVYGRFVNDLAKYGTLGSCVFATSSTEGTERLYEAYKAKGIRAFVGKVNMVRNAPDFIIEEVQASLDGLKYLIEKYKDEPLVKPIVTPRFAPTSTEESMEALGKIAKEYNLPVQSHISENPSEIAWIKELYTWSKNYADVYDKFNLYGETPTIMAHAVHLNDDERKLSQNPNVYLAHCPDSNVNIVSGIAPVKQYMELGIKVGLGSDIAGGHKIQMNEAIVRAIQLSKIKSFYEENNTPLSLSEAFHMGTAVGGEYFGKVGKLKPGYELDALIIDDHELYKERYTLLDRIEKFLYIGDDRWIVDRYVAGNKIDC